MEDVDASKGIYAVCGQLWSGRIPLPSPFFSIRVDPFAGEQTDSCVGSDLVLVFLVVENWESSFVPVGLLGDVCASFGFGGGGWSGMCAIGGWVLCEECVVLRLCFLWSRGWSGCVRIGGLLVH